MIVMIVVIAVGDGDGVDGKLEWFLMRGCARELLCDWVNCCLVGLRRGCGLLHTSAKKT